jgi:hypothetical protein
LIVCDALDVRASFFTKDYKEENVSSYRRENAERIEWIIDGCDQTNPPLIIPV